jgi:hypothetical protein
MTGTTDFRSLETVVRWQMQADAETLSALESDPSSRPDSVDRFGAALNAGREILLEIDARRRIDGSIDG